MHQRPPVSTPSVHRFRALQVELRLFKWRLHATCSKLQAEASMVLAAAIGMQAVWRELVAVARTLKRMRMRSATKARQLSTGH